MHEHEIQFFKSYIGAWPYLYLLTYVTLHMYCGFTVLDLCRSVMRINASSTLVLSVPIADSRWMSLVSRQALHSHITIILPCTPLETMSVMPTSLYTHIHLCCSTVLPRFAVEMMGPNQIERKDNVVEGTVTATYVQCMNTRHSCSVCATCVWWETGSDLLSVWFFC